MDDRAAMDDGDVNDPSLTSAVKLAVSTPLAHPQLMGRMRSSA